MSDYHEGLEEGIKIGKEEAADLIKAQAARIKSLDARIAELKTELKGGLQLCLGCSQRRAGRREAMSEIRPELHLWVAYLEKKEELEEAQDRIAELEAALHDARARYIELNDKEAAEAMAEIINKALGNVK